MTQILRSLFCLCILLLHGSISHAQPTSPRPLPGFVHEEGSTIVQGAVLSGRSVTLSSPTIAEVDGDTSNGKEVVVGGADGIVYAYRSNGTLLWQVTAPNYGCSETSGTNRLASSPAVGEIFGDGVPYVVIGYGGSLHRTCDGGVMAIRGPNGVIAWTFSISAFSKRIKSWAYSNSVVSSPALARVDKSRKMVIGFGAFDRNVYLLNANGSVRWYYNAADTVWSSPAFANVDKDPDLEMIIGTDITANSALKPPTLNGGYVYAFKTKARKNKHIRFRDKSAYVWQRYLPQVVYSSPVVADVFPAIPGDEIIVSSGCFFPENFPNKDGRWVKILRAKNGAVLQTLNLPSCSSASPAVADIDEDGTLEIIAMTNPNLTDSGYRADSLMAFKPEIADPIWTVRPRLRSLWGDLANSLITPVIGDVDGNGSLEVVVPVENGLSIHSARDGSTLSCEEYDCGPEKLLIDTKDKVRSSAALGDINGDGILDIVAAGGSTIPGFGGIYAWTDLHEFSLSAPGSGTPYAAPWAMFHGCASHVGSTKGCSSGAKK